MIGIADEGFDVLVDGKFYRFDFDSTISTPKEARIVLVKMANEAAEYGLVIIK
ncbi:MAG: hypothetical protein ACE5JB_07945 [bacterium]